jgi:hypothetical protein
VGRINILHHCGMIVLGRGIILFFVKYYNITNNIGGINVVLLIFNLVV